MTDAGRKMNVAILAVPEVTASAAYAMYDLFVGGRQGLGIHHTGVAGRVAHAALYRRGSARRRSVSANGIMHQARLHDR